MTGNKPWPVSTDHCIVLNSSSRNKWGCVDDHFHLSKDSATSCHCNEITFNSCWYAGSNKPIKHILFNKKLLLSLKFVILQTISEQHLNNSFYSADTQVLHHKNFLNTEHQVIEDLSPHRPSTSGSHWGFSEPGLGLSHFTLLLIN